MRRVLCTYGIVMLISHYMLLASPGMLLYWMIVYVYVLHVYDLCMWMISDYRSMSISLHPPSYNNDTKKVFLLRDTRNAWIFHMSLLFFM